jgi:predicted RecA/RadA family phage recombinase
MKNFIEEGKVIQHVLVADVVAGGVVKIGNLLGVAVTSGVTGDTIAVALHGVYELPKLSSDNMMLGLPVYWDTTPGECTLTSDLGNNKLIGYVWKAAGAGTTTVQVLLDRGI